MFIHNNTKESVYPDVKEFLEQYTHKLLLKEAQEKFTYKENALAILKPLGICSTKAYHDKSELMVTRDGKEAGVELKLSPNDGGSLVVKYVIDKDQKGKWVFGRIGKNVKKVFLAKLAETWGVLDLMNGKDHPWSKLTPHLQTIGNKNKIVGAANSKEAYELDAAQYNGSVEVKIGVAGATANYYLTKDCSYLNVGTHGLYTLNGIDKLDLQKLVDKKIPDFTKNCYEEIKVRCQYTGNGKYQFTMTLQFKGMTKSPFNIAPLNEISSIDTTKLANDPLVLAW
jgi:hypothetical protein